MKISDNVFMLKVGEENGVYPVLIAHEKGAALVDACFPNQEEGLKAALAEVGFGFADITEVFLTHQDLDHLGLVNRIRAESPSLKVYAHEREVEYIDGTSTPVKMAKREARYPEMSPEERENFDRMKRGFAAASTKVDVTLVDGEVLNLAGGITAVHVPGHTPGHMCLYLTECELLIAGDGLNISDGELTGPNPVHTFDMDEATNSLKKLLEYDIGQIICYHGGLFEGDVSGSIGKIIGARG